MLDQIDLEDFKCFELLRLPLRPLTLLSGSNSSGKSSVLQALVLLQQTMREHEWSTRLMLNGASVRLGAVSDVVDEFHGTRTFKIGLVASDVACRWTFTGERTEMSMAVVEIVMGSKKRKEPKVLRFLLPPKADHATTSLAMVLRGLTYITAERLGPREIYAVEDPQIATVVGPAGEHAISILYSGRDEPVQDELALSGRPATLRHQVEERMRTFFPGFALEVQRVQNSNSVTLGLRIADDMAFHRPINSGFGITQTLPIVIAALAAAKGDILLIENPEVHLHPAGQALMGQFLAEVAQGGIQVIVETHSDHVLNGIRRSVKSRRLEAENVAIHFFRPRSENEAQVLSPALNGEGDIDSWPPGFFDQFDSDTNYLAGWGN